MSFLLDENALIFLKNKGFSISPRKPVKKMTLKEINANLFSFLESNERTGFFFIKYPDELIEIESNKKKFNLFGKSKLGFFAIDENGKIYLLSSNENEIFNYHLFVFANSSLEKFIKSYSLFIACIFLLRFEQSYTLEEHSINSESNIDKVISNFISKMLSIENEINIEGNFWNHIISSVENLDIKLNLSLVDYLSDGRFD